jgi:plasmid stabilization system protein ParE
MYEVRISEPARQDLQAAFAWWRANRSVEQASRWYRGIHKAISSLKQMPLRCPPALEADLLAQGIRQLAFGVGTRPTHRIVFTIAENVVTILRVRHAAQDFLSEEDIT